MGDIKLGKLMPVWITYTLAPMIEGGHFYQPKCPVVITVISSMA